MRLITKWIGPAAPGLIIVAGCATPTITFFRAEPNMICPGDVVTLSWSADARGVLSSDGGISTAESVSKDGSKEFSPPTTTHYRLDVSAFGKTASREDVVTVATTPKMLTVIAAAASLGATCAHGRLTLEAHAPPPLWGTTVLVDRITRVGARSLRVEHQGREVDLETPEAASAFAGTVAQGDWTFSIALEPGENCESSTLPPNLGINIQLRCNLTGISQ